MHFIIKRSLLLNHLMKTNKAVSIRNPLPSLTGILFTLQKDCLILTGSDSDLTIQTILYPQDDDLQILEEGSIVLSAKYILEIVKKIDSEHIDIQIVDGQLTRIKGLHSEFNLNGTNSQDYPNIDLHKSGSLFTLNAMVLKEVINQTRFAASDLETKPILTGINFKARDHILECIATDSYRLAKKTFPLSDPISFNIIIPKKSLEEVAKIIEKEEDITIYVSDRKVLFCLDTLLIQTRLIDGHYPDTSRLLDIEKVSTLQIDTTYLLSAIDRVALLTDEQNQVIRFTMKENEILLSSFNQEVGSVEESIINCTYTGNPLEISFSCKYVKEAIRCFLDESIQLSFSGIMKPFIITGCKSKDVVQLLLPIKTYY